MILPKPQPVDSTKNLRDRVDRLFREPVKKSNKLDQQTLDLSTILNCESKIDYPSKNITGFLNFITDAIPDGDVYLFGGVLRDLALLGRKGFNSDIDLVVEGNWSHFVTYLESLNVDKNKFGGYRLTVDGWPVDIWNAKETWAIKQGLVPYKGIASLTETTVLNWDAILMNWRTKNFVYRKNYFEEINSRVLDIVLEKNPNPLGMAVRVFRHLCLKDARKITPAAAKYLAKCADMYSFEVIREAEIGSYKNTIVAPAVHRFFEHIDTAANINIQHQFSIASDILKKELGLNDLGLQKQSQT